MDAEDIAKMVKDLQLSHAKDVVHIVLKSDLAQLGRKRLESCLVDKVFSSKYVNRETFCAQMPHILQIKKSVTLRMWAKIFFSFDFISDVN